MLNSVIHESQIIIHLKPETKLILLVKLCQFLQVFLQVQRRTEVATAGAVTQLLGEKKEENKYVKNFCV